MPCVFSSVFNTVQAVYSKLAFRKYQLHFFLPPVETAKGLNQNRSCELLYFYALYRRLRISKNVKIQICRTIIMPDVLNVCENWSLTLRALRWLGDERAWVLRKISGPKRRGIARSKRDGTRAETRFGLSAKRTSPFKSAGVSVQSTTGSRGVRISGRRLYRPCSDVQCKTTGYPLHLHLSPSLPLLCVTVCHQVLNAL